MITRDIAQLRTVTGFEQLPTTTTATNDGAEGSRGVSNIHTSYTVFNASCGGMNGDATANGVMGLIIDRLGLGRGYNNVLLSARGTVDIGTSTLDAKFGAIYAFLYHSSTTCADDFDRFSTESEKARGRAFLLNTTSTLASGFMATSTAAATFGTFSATATGAARADYNAFYPLEGAQRYLRPLLFVEAYASSSGGSQFVTAGVDFVFGEPDEAPRTTTSTGSILRN